MISSEMGDVKKKLEEMSKFLPVGIPQEYKDAVVELKVLVETLDKAMDKQESDWTDKYDDVAEENEDLKEEYEDDESETNVERYRTIFVEGYSAALDDLRKRPEAEGAYGSYVMLRGHLKTLQLWKEGTLRAHIHPPEYHAKKRVKPSVAKG